MIQIITLNDDWPAARQKFDTHPICSLDLDKHEWRHVVFDKTIIAVVCIGCGRYPLEILGEWPIVRSD